MVVSNNMANLSHHFSSTMLFWDYQCMCWIFDNSQSFLNLVLYAFSAICDCKLVSLDDSLCVVVHLFDVCMIAFEYSEIKHVLTITPTYDEYTIRWRLTSAPCNQKDTNLPFKPNQFYNIPFHVVNLILWIWRRSKKKISNRRVFA